MWVFTRAKRYNNKVREGRPIFFIRKFSKLRRLFCNFGHLDESSMSSKVDPTVFADNMKLQRGGIEENPDDVAAKAARARLSLGKFPEDEPVVEGYNVEVVPSLWRACIP